jgi:hypothetical protein
MTAYRPQLRCYQNWLALDGLLEPRSGWMQTIQDAGYDGVQFVEPLDLALVDQVLSRGLGVCGSGRVNLPEDAERLAREAHLANLECLTLHVGWGYENDDQAVALIEAVLAASSRHSIPLYVETHRATIFQDMWRTMHFVDRFGHLEFNGDFSHWYTGCEMVYGGFHRKVSFIQPIIDRVRFMHGRIGSPGCMQVNIGTVSEAKNLSFVQHFCTLWTKVFENNIRSGTQKQFTFATELLAANVFYAREFHGKEESDRWSQSLVLMELAKECFEIAQKAVESGA